VEGRKLDVGLLYGYSVCLVTVIVFLFVAARMTNGILDMRELPYTESYIHGPSLVSLGSYRLDLVRRIGIEGCGGAAASVLPTDSDLARMFEAERLHRLALSHQVSRSAILSSLVLALLAALLFAGHWKWLRGRERTASMAG
jgi:hypothetical protein